MEVPTNCFSGLVPLRQGIASSYLLAMTGFFLAFLFSTPTLAQREGHIVGQSANIYFKRSGTGRALLILNELGQSSAGTEALVQRLAKRNGVIVYDQRGTGQTRLPRLDTSTVNLRKLVEDVESVRSVLKLSTLTLVPLGNAREVAEAYAARYPQRVDGVLFLNRARATGPSRMDSLLALTRAVATPNFSTTKPVLRQNFTGSPGDFAEIEAFITRHRLHYVAPKSPQTRRPVGSRHLSRKRN
jgi:pimeloyl-ACP methyl ester carboxylesterase